MYLRLLKHELNINGENKIIVIFEDLTDSITVNIN